MKAPSDRRLAMWIIWYAVALNLWRGLLLIYDEAAGNTTSTHTLILLLPNHVMAGFVSILVALLAVLYGFLSYWHEWRRTWLLLPQFLVLILASVEAFEAISTSRFSDGVVRPWAFIAADQGPSIIMAFIYGLAVLEIYRPLIWNIGGPSHPEE